MTIEQLVAAAKAAHDIVGRADSAGAVNGFDAIRANISHMPKGAQHAGYTTGTDGSGGTLDIRWRNDDFNDDPGAVRICQDSGATDHTADVLDVESGAATIGDCAPWVHAARDSFDKATRPGQRKCAIYTSAANVSAVVNALIAGGVHSDVRLWVANWNLSDAQAIQEVVDAAGPFPIVAVQYSSGEFYDYDAFGVSWLEDVSGAINPVGNLRVTNRGFTGITLMWDAAKATHYVVKTYRARSGRLKSRVVVNAPAVSVRVGRLWPRRTYQFEVSARPGSGENATVKATCR